MKWVIQLLYPTLLGWNQWAWDRRRYHSVPMTFAEYLKSYLQNI